MAAEHCLLLALPCGRDPLDVHAQTRALKTSFISYLMQKQAAGIINVTSPQVNTVCSNRSFMCSLFVASQLCSTHLPTMSVLSWSLSQGSTRFAEQCI